MRLQLEVLSTYTFKREIPQLMGIFSLTAQAMGEADFYALAHQFFGTQDIRDKNIDHFSREFRKFMKQNPRYSHESDWQELVRLDWLCHLARKQSQLMMSFFLIGTGTPTLHVENMIPTSNLKGKSPRPKKIISSIIGDRKKLPHYYIIFCTDQKLQIRKIKKIEFQILNWKRQGDSDEAIRKKMAILGLSEIVISNTLSNLNGT